MLMLAVIPGMKIDKTRALKHRFLSFSLRLFNHRSLPTNQTKASCLTHPVLGNPCFFLHPAKSVQKFLERVVALLSENLLFFVT